MTPAPAPKYSGNNLLQIALPMGGIGAGTLCLTGYGALEDFSIRNLPATSALPDGHRPTDAAFALLHIKGDKAVTRLVEGPMPKEKMYNFGLQGQGFRKGGHEGLPRFRHCEFSGHYPFGNVSLSDPKVPLDVTVTGWNPYIPLDDINSGIPGAILEYTLRNDSSATVDFEFSFHLSHLALGKSGWKATRNEKIGESGVFFRNNEHQKAESFGSAGLIALTHNTRIKTMWLRSGWFDSVAAIWREVDEGRFQENEGADKDYDGRNGGSILIAGSLKAGEKLTIPLAITWYFPNSYVTARQPAKECDDGCCCDDPQPAWRPYFVNHWKDARDVAAYLKKNYAELRRRTVAFQEALISSTLPPEVVEAVSANLGILKSPTVLRQENGNVWAWEGCFTSSGCCSGTCTHVWNYAQALPHLYPALERTLREQELLRAMHDDGHTDFRAALPDGPGVRIPHAASDGQLGGIMKLYRDWQICGDTEWLKTIYPRAQKSLRYCMNIWDPDRKGVLIEPHHNTYDIEFWGPDGMCSSIYLGALIAMAEMAAAVGDTEADSYRELADKGATFLDAELFNGEFYEQKVMWKEIRNENFDELLARDTISDEERELCRREGPKYQYGAGCMSDGVIGAWMSKIYGIDSPQTREKVRASLQAIVRHNFKENLFEHPNPERPGYAWGDEPGLLVCTWPRGGRPILPFPYADEVFTGIEYQVASHLIEEGMVEDGLKIVRAARSRYDGHVRNPFNEYECGNYYARALASYALLGSLSGFRYSAVSKTLWFGPRVGTDPFQVFFSTATGWGVLRLEGTKFSVRVIEGELKLERVVFTRGSESVEIPWKTTVAAGNEASQEISPATAG